MTNREKLEPFASVFLARDCRKRCLADARDEARWIYKRFGIDVEIAGICVRDISKNGMTISHGILFAPMPMKLLHDDSIMLSSAYRRQIWGARCYRKALRSRKHVITANKLVLAHELPRLRKLADRSGVNLFYSASVCGSVPVLNALDNLRTSDTIKSIQGIVMARRILSWQAWRITDDI